MSKELLYLWHRLPLQIKSKVKSWNCWKLQLNRVSLVLNRVRLKYTVLWVAYLVAQTGALSKGMHHSTWIRHRLVVISATIPRLENPSRTPPLLCYCVPVTRSRRRRSRTWQGECSICAAIQDVDLSAWRFYSLVPKIFYLQKTLKCFGDQTTYSWSWKR